MNVRVLRALLWKDYRVHRPVLVLGGLMLLLPYVGGILGILLSERALSTIWTQAEALVSMSFSGLALTLVTTVGLAGGAFAAEREDRSSEFMACLPTSRWMKLCSKVLLLTAAVLSMWLFNLAGLAFLIVFEVSPQGFSQVIPVLGTLRTMMAIGVLLFGAAWLASACLRQPTVASACGLAAPVIALFGVHGLEWGLAPEALAHGDIYRAVCLTLGLVSFAAGCVVYLARFES